MKKKEKYIENISKNNTDSFSYSGIVRVKILKGNHIYSSKTIKNKGRWPLFNFFSLCLKGDYQSATAFQPKVINIFNVGEPGEDEIPNISDDTGLNLSGYFNITNRVNLTPYPLNSSPDVSKTPDESSGITVPIGSSSITFKFLIPFTQLNISGINNCINGLGLYCNQFLQSSNLDNPSAFFFIPELDSNNKPTGKLGNLLEGIGNTIDLSEYNLSIEWELMIGNK